MKRILLAIAPVFMFVTVSAQTGIIDGRCERYYYSRWYDECPAYIQDSTFIEQLVRDNNGWAECHFFDLYPDDATNSSDTTIMRDYTPRKLAIKGLAAMVMRSAYDVGLGTIYNISPDRLAEHLILYQGDTTAPGNRRCLDSVRWDTASPHIIRMPKCVRSMEENDTSSFMYGLVYEAFFEKTLFVDSVFYIGGTFRSNDYSPYGAPLYSNMPTVYLLVRYVDIDPCVEKCDLASSCRHFWSEGANWTDSYEEGWALGPFFAILDTSYYRLTVDVDSVGMGQVSGEGLYQSMSYALVSATPNPGYRFSHWADGVTDNPRLVEIFSDTTLTAIFTDTTMVYVGVAVNNPNWGIAAGAGDYPVGLPVTVSALPVDSLYTFVSWSDNVAENPRVVVPVSDTVFTAIFRLTADSVGIAEVGESKCGMQVFPNPTQSDMTVKVGVPGEYRIAIHSIDGRLMEECCFVGNATTIDISRLPGGTYLLTLTPSGKTDERTVKSFIKK